MFRKGTKIKKQPHNIVLNRGGLGDQICRLPAIKHVLSTYTYIEFTMYCPDYFIPMLEYALKDIGVKHRIKSLGSFDPEKHNDVPTLFINEQAVTTLKSHLVDYAYWFYADQQPIEPSAYDYPRLHVDIDKKKLGLPERYVVIATEYTAPVRQPSAELINGFAGWLLAQGITPVFLGKGKEKMVSMNKKDGGVLEIESHASSKISFDVGLDLRGKTTLLESVGVIDGALACAGIDCGILHLAGLTDTAIIAGYTTVRPEHRLPYRHGQRGWNCYTVTPGKELPCRFCQSNWHLIYNHDFRTCLYKDLLCVKMIQSKHFISLMEKILGEKDAV